MEFRDWIFIISMCIIWFLVGYSAYGLIPINNDSCLDRYAGLWMPDRYGGDNWICINIEDMPIEDMIETCKHEVGHEIFDRRNMTNDTEEFAEVNIIGVNV